MPEAARKQSPILMPDRMGLAEHKRQDWVVEIPVGLTLEDVMQPGYWAHVAAQMDPLDTVQCRWEDGSLIAWFVVKFCERNYATLVLDRKLELGQEREVPQQTMKHKVEWKGPVLRFCVIRMSDQQVIHEGEREKQAAYNWMIEHEKAQR